MLYIHSLVPLPILIRFITIYNLQLVSYIYMLNNKIKRYIYRHQYPFLFNIIFIFTFYTYNFTLFFLIHFKIKFIQYINKIMENVIVKFYIISLI